MHIKEQDEILSKVGVPIHPLIVRRQECEYELADYIYVSSSLVEESFKKYGLGDKVVRNPLGIDTKRFVPAKKEEEKEEDVPFNVLSVGTVGAQKGHDILLKAWVRLNFKDSNLVFVGGMGTGIDPVYHRHKSRFSHVAYPSEHMPSVYQKASIYVHASRQDGWCLAVGEAMASGLPVIVSDMTGAKDLIVDGKNGFIVPTGDIDALAEKIQWCKDNPEELIKMGLRARTTAKHFDWERYRQRYLKFMEEFI